MADKVVEQAPVMEKAEKEKKAEVDVVDAAAEEKSDEPEGDVKENGDAEKEATNGTSESKTHEADEDKCCVKRKSTGGETEEAPTEEVIPEKKAKLDETPAQEAESNGEPEVAA